MMAINREELCRKWRQERNRRYDMRHRYHRATMIAKKQACEEIVQFARLRTFGAGAIPALGLSLEGAIAVNDLRIPLLSGLCRPARR